MELEKKLSTLQFTYAASVAETVNTLNSLGALDTTVAKRKLRQAQAAPMLNRQVGVESVKDVFSKLVELYGCANWTVQKTSDGYDATATTCMLCALSKKMGGANPCHGWCLDPMIAMIGAVSGIPEDRITVESTLMDSDACRMRIEAE
jgi:hypothetical protein